MTTIKPDWPAPANIHAFTTTKHVWGSNLKTDREELDKLFALPKPPFWLNQVHGNSALEVEYSNDQRDADAAYTDKPGAVCVVLTADCLPILLCDKSGQSVAAIHAGWKGLAAGVIENTVKCMHATPDNLMAWLGPAIGPNKFEVRRDVYQAFTADDSQAQQYFKAISDDQWLADLYGLATSRLNRLGITDIHGGKYCTHTQSDDFYSYRRDGAQTGRMATLVWIGKN